MPAKIHQKRIGTRKLVESSLNQVSVEGKRLNRQSDSIRTTLNPDLRTNSEKITLVSPNPEHEFETFESRF